MRLARRVDQGRGAFSEHGRHHEVLGGRYRHIVRPGPGPAEAPGEAQDDLAPALEAGAEAGEDLEVRVELADAEGAAFGIHRNAQALHPAQQRREEQHRGAHPRGQLALHPARLEAAVVEGHRPGWPVPADARALLLQKGHQLLHVRNRGDVREGHGLVREQTRAEDRQHGVLVARGSDGAGERFAAVDDEIGHRVGTGPRKRASRRTPLNCGGEASPRKV